MSISSEQIKQVKDVIDTNWKRMWRDLEEEGIHRTNLWDIREQIPFWDETYDQDMPSLAILPVHKEKRGIVIVNAGGAFLFKSSNEAKPVAEAFHKRGLNAAILDYRVKPYGYEASAADAIRAVRYLRYHADHMGIDGSHIGFGGFSAGGMLTSLVNMNFDSGLENDPDPINRVSSRPDAEFQIYGSFTNFELYEPRQLGVIDYDAEKTAYIASQDILLQLPLNVPPLFMAATDADDPRFLLKMANAWADRGVYFESHLFHGGAHGGGLFNGKDETPEVPHTAHWFELAAEWFEMLGF